MGLIKQNKRNTCVGEPRVCKAFKAWPPKTID